MVNELFDEINTVNDSFVKMRQRLKHEFLELKRKNEHRKKDKVQESQSKGQLQQKQVQDMSNVSTPNLNKSKNVTVGNERDDFDYATSWKRAFQQIYLKYSWLNSFAQINQIAIERILQEISSQLLTQQSFSLLILKFNCYVK